MKTMTSERPLSMAGIFPPIPTPFKANGEISFDDLRTNLEKWNEEPLSGYVVGGSNGEFVSLTVEERVKVVRTAREVIPTDRLLIAGSGMETTRATIDLTQRMAEAGADAVLVVTPSYYKSKMKAAELEHHYREVADSSPVALLLYNVPANTGVDIPVEAVIHLAPHPNIIGIKDSGGNVTKIGSMVYETPDDFQVLAGSAGFMLGALAVGAVGVIAALANLMGRSLAEMLVSFQNGDLVRCRQIQLPLIEVNTAVTARFGVPGLKAALDMLGYYGGPVRSPLLPLLEGEKTALREILEKVGLL
jgi:4-hydroxy-2-oxoglutarate aldolase